MAMARAMQAFQRQAADWIAATHQALAAAGLGFTDGDRAAAELRARVADDVVLGAFYGQLFAAA
jgi:hypothetical protein